MKDNRWQRRAALLGAALALLLAGGCAKEEPAESSHVGPLRVAIPSDYPPYAYLLDGELVGSDVEIARRIARDLKRNIQFIPATFSDLVKLVNAGKADFAICAIANTAERRKFVDFSDPYEFAGQTVLVRADSGLRDITDIREQPGFRIATEEGSTAHGIMTRMARVNAVLLQVIDYPDNRKAVGDLLLGKADAVVLDPLVARCQMIEFPGKMAYLDDFLNHEEFCVAVGFNRSGLMAAANRVIHQLWETGEIYELQERYIAQSLKQGEFHGK